MHAHSIPDLTLPQMLRQRAQTHPERVALHQKDYGIWQPLNWHAYYQRAGWFGLGMRSLGLRPGGHVGIIAENRTEWVLAQMGCGLVGAVTVGVYPTSPWPEVAYVVNHADVEVVVCEDQEQADKIAEAIEQLPQLRHVIVVEPDGFRNTDPRIAAITLLYDEVEARGREYEQQHADLIASVAGRREKPKKPYWTAT